MSREQYQPPPTQDSYGGSSQTQGGGFNSQPANYASSSAPVITYICGDCDAKVRLDRGAMIACTTCGHRVLYKERTKRMVQFQAR